MSRMWIGKGILVALAALVGMAAAARAGEVQVAESRPKFFEMRRIIVPIIHGDTLAGQLTIVVFLELEEGADRDTIREALPRLRDAYFRRLKRHTELQRNIMTHMPLTKIKRLLMEANLRILGPGVVRDVLVQNAILRQY